MGLGALDAGATHANAQISPYENPEASGAGTVSSHQGSQATGPQASRATFPLSEAGKSEGQATQTQKARARESRLGVGVLDGGALKLGLR